MRICIQMEKFIEYVFKFCYNSSQLELDCQVIFYYLPLFLPMAEPATLREYVLYPNNGCDVNFKVGVELSILI